MKDERTIDEVGVLEAVAAWCSPAFASGVRESGVYEILDTLADVKAVRTIYQRRRRNLDPDSPHVAEIDGLLRTLDELGAGDFRMIAFRARNGANGFVVAPMAARPVFAFALPSREEDEAQGPSVRDA